MTNNNVPRPEYEKYRGMRALLLTRVSSVGQRHDAQERVIREKLIEPLYLSLDEERHVIHDTYTGLEYRYREALDKILQMAERKEFDVLCLDVLDRGLGRKGVAREIFRGQLREFGIRVLTTEPSDHSDDDSLEGQLMRLLKGYKAEEEINDFVRRSKNAKRDKALGNEEKGIPPKAVGNGRSLYGYTYTFTEKGKRDTMVLKHEIVFTDCKGVAWSEVRVMTFIFRCAHRGIPLRRIAIRLNKIGIPAPSVSKGLKVTSRGVKAEKIIWQTAVISRLLRHTGYSGKEPVFAKRSVKVPGKKWARYERTPEEQIIVPIPAIVSEEFQNEVLKRLERNKKISSRNNKQPELTLLRGGLGKCGHCGRNLTPHVRPNHYKNRPEGQRDQLGYQCQSKSSGLHPCPGCYILVPILDKIVWEKVLEIIRDPSIIDNEIARRRVGDPTSARRRQINKDIKNLREERTNLQTNLLRMVSSNLLDRDTEGVLTRRLKELEDLERKYNSELLDDERIHREWEQIQNKLNDLHKKCSSMRERLSDPTYNPSYDRKREMVELLGISVQVWENGHNPRYKISVNPPNVVSLFSLRE